MKNKNYLLKLILLAATMFCATNVFATCTPSVTISSNKGNTICQGTTVKFTATPTNGGKAPKYQWIKSGSNVGTNSATYTVSALFSGDVISCVMTSNDACASPKTATSNSIQMTVEVVPNCTISGGSSFCAGSSEELCAPSGFSYLWNQGATTQCLLVNTAGTFSVTVTNGNGCSSTCSRTVTANPAPSCTITGNSSFCFGDSSVLCAPAGAGLSYSWSNGHNLQCINIAAGGTFSVTVVDTFGCSSTCSKTVTRIPLPSITPDDPAPFCAGGSVTLTASLGANYKWSPGGQTSQSIDANASGVYSVTESICITPTPVTVTVNPKPSEPGAITGSKSVCKKTTHVYSIAAAANATSYVWTVPKGSTIEGSTTGTSITVLYGSTAGDITVKGSNDCGLSAARSLAIKMNCREEESGDNITEAGFNAVVYPNPTNGLAIVQFTSDASAVYTIEMLDITGREVMNKQGNAEEGTNFIQLDMNSYSKGIYFLRVQSGGNNELLKLIVE